MDHGKRKIKDVSHKILVFQFVDRLKLLLRANWIRCIKFTMTAVSFCLTVEDRPESLNLLITYVFNCFTCRHTRACAIVDLYTVNLWKCILIAFRLINPASAGSERFISKKLRELLLYAMRWRSVLQTIWWPNYIFLVYFILSACWILFIGLLFPRWRRRVARNYQ